MDDNTITALIAGVAGLVTIFFGRAYWRTFRGLIMDGQELAVSLQRRLDECQRRLDALELEYHKAVLERERLANLVDIHATRSQELAASNSILRDQIRGLAKRLSKYEAVRGEDMGDIG